MATDKDSIVTRIQALEAEKSKLIDEAKKEALAKAKQAIANLNALGFRYRLEQGTVSRKAVARGTGGIPDKRCPICKFQTRPPHDARRHRFAAKAKKRPFNAKELADLGLRRV
jgi:hypothetical protein